jgi:hypothetical protein
MPQGLRKELEAGRKRHPFAANHSQRKWFKTRCELAGMKPINIENLMGHSTGISDAYYRPTENDLLEDYLKCVDAITINDEKTLLTKVEDLVNRLMTAVSAQEFHWVEQLMSRKRSSQDKINWS